MAKLLAALAITTAALTSPASAGWNKELGAYGRWRTYIAKSDDGTSFCGMATSTADSAQALHIKWDGNNDNLQLTAFKMSWRIPNGTKVSINIGVDKNLWRGDVSATGETAKVGSGSMGHITYYIDSNDIEDFLHEVSEANTLWIQFNEGNEPDWKAAMDGSRKAVAALKTCVSNLPANKGGSATQPFNY
jgi:hypothetical protein